MANPATYESIQHVPLAVEFSTRSGVTVQDAYAQNVFLEKSGEGHYSVKRPGLKVIGNLVTGVGVGGTPVSLPSYALQGAFRSSYSGTPNLTVAVLGDKPILFTGQSTSTDQAITVGSTLTGNPSGCTYRGLYFNIGTSATSYLLLQGPTNLSQIFPNVIIGVPTTATLVPSLCELDGTLYVMDVLGTIWASGYQTPATWPTLNFVAALPDGEPVALVKHLTYLLAFSTSQVKVYYDAAVSPGAPIAQVMSAGGQVGVARSAAETIKEIDDVTYWLSRGATAGLAVYQMAGLNISKISTPAIERVLTEIFGRFEGVFPTTSPMTSTSVIRGIVYREAGHTFYTLTVPSIVSPFVFPGMTLTYDITVGQWVTWTQIDSTDTETELRVAASLPESGLAKGLCFDRDNGQIYMLDSATYKDGAKLINVVIQTDSYNWGNQRMKFVPATYVKTDTVAASNLFLSWSDNDYATFNTPQYIDLSLPKKQLIRCGSTVERAWKLTHNSNTPMRFYELEVEVQAGAL